MLRKNIILIGFMGSGKTSIGKKLAKELSMDLYDMDKLLVERFNRSISEVFEKNGEEYFRSEETKLLKELSTDMDNGVLSTGGGIIVREENIPILKSMGRVIYLETSPESIIARLAGDETRPLLQGHNKKQKIQEILDKRAPIYKAASHEIINTDGKTIVEIVSLIR